LDPNRKAVAVNGTDESPSTVTESSPEAVDDGTPMIVHRVPFVDEKGVQRVHEYGPMPVSEYAEWERGMRARGEL
jgi:hypothetical protein